MKVKTEGVKRAPGGRSWTRALLAAAAITAVATAPANAATFVVNTSLDQVDDDTLDGECLTTDGTCSLRAAIMQANALGGFHTVRIALAGTLRLTRAGSGEDGGVNGDLDINTPMAIRGDGYNVTTIDAYNLDRAFHVATGVTASIDGVKIIKGKADNGGCILNDGALSLFLVAIEKCTAEVYGGAIHNGATASSLSLENVIIKGNKTLFGPGGGIASVNGTTQGSRVVVASNKAATAGGGLYLEVGGDPSNWAESVFSGNKAGSTAQGGGIHAQSELSASLLFVRGNSAGYGGGIEMFGGTLEMATVEGNKAAVLGGGVLVHGSELRQVAVLKNKSVDGGGIYVGSGTVDVRDSVVALNKATNLGGGYFDGGGGAVTLKNITFFKNTTTTSNSASIHVGAFGTTEIQNSIVATTGSQSNCGGTLTVTGPSLDSGATCGMAISNTDPMLGTLVYSWKGLETVWAPKLIPPFYWLRTGSPAIDAADTAACSSSDIRGGERIVDGDGDGNADCDLGAFEAGGSY